MKPRYRWRERWGVWKLVSGDGPKWLRPKLYPMRYDGLSLVVDADGRVWTLK